jgi:Leucine-rich repeat (LRR) protein
MNLEKVLGTDVRLIDLIARNLHVPDLLVLSLVCKNFETFQAEAFHWQSQVSDDVRLCGKGMKRLSLSFCVVHTLRSLDFSNNDLSLIPREIGNLKSLTHLDLGYNQLTFIPSEVGQLQSLKYLFLQSNQLDLIPSEIGQLRSLLCLDVRGNPLPFIQSEIGQNQKRLQFFADISTIVVDEVLRKNAKPATIASYHSHASHPRLEGFSGSSLGSSTS